MKRTMLRNIQRMRAASERNRRARTPSSNPMTSTAPLSDKDMMDMCNGVVAEAKKPQVKKCSGALIIVNFRMNQLYFQLFCQMIQYFYRYF